MASNIYQACATSLVHLVRMPDDRIPKAVFYVHAPPVYVIMKTKRCDALKKKRLRRKYTQPPTNIYLGV